MSRVTSYLDAQLSSLKASSQWGRRVDVRLQGSRDSTSSFCLSQSCDLAIQANGRRRTEQVVVCPIWEFSQLREVLPTIGRELLGNVIRGRVPAWHALAPCTLRGFERQHLFADFNRIATVPITWVETLAIQQSPRLRLRSPWREHMSAAVGLFFSRPAIPEPIPPLPPTS